TRVSFLPGRLLAAGFGAPQFRLEGGVEAEFAGGRLLADEALVEGGGDAVQVRLRLADGRGGEGDGELVGGDGDGALVALEAVDLDDGLLVHLVGSEPALE